VVVLKTNRKPGPSKGRTRAPRRNQPPAAGSGSRAGSLAAFARDLAVKINASFSGRPGRPVQRLEQPRVRPLRASATGGPLAHIADRVLAMNLKNPMHAMEMALLTQAMVATRGNITASGRLLGIHRKAVERHLAKHKIQRVKAKRARK
jgi:DNA-binding NtrC family response regulator